MQENVNLFHANFSVVANHSCVSQELAEAALLIPIAHHQRSNAAVGVAVCCVRHAPSLHHSRHHAAVTVWDGSGRAEGPHPRKSAGQDQGTLDRENRRSGFQKVMLFEARFSE